MPERFSDRTYAAPFGRFEADAEAESPANEVLVGREGQRAYFIDILLRSGRRGAFLVTGNRGVGKSSFVRYCLREYEEEVFERFLRGNVGRTTFWDRIVVLSLFFAAPLVLLMISEFMELVTLAAVGSRAHFGSSPASFLALLVILPLFIFAIYPLLFGWEALSQVYATRFPRRKASTLAFVTTAGLIAATWGLSPFGAPALSVSRLFCILAGLYLWVRCSSFHAPPPLATEPATWGRRERRRRYLHRWLFGHPGWFALFAAIPLVLGIAPFRYLDWTRKLFSSNDTTTSFRSFWGNLAIGLMLLGMGAFLHGLHLRRQPDLGGAVHDPSKRLLRRSGGATYIFGGLLVALFAAAVLRTQDLFTLVFALGVCLSSLAAFGVIRSWYKRWWREAACSSPAGIPPVPTHDPGQPLFRPRPRQALLLKAAISLVLGLQLAFPVLQQFSGLFGRHMSQPLATTVCRWAGTADRFLDRRFCVEFRDPCSEPALRCPAPLWRVPVIQSRAWPDYSCPAWNPQPAAMALEPAVWADSECRDLLAGKRAESCLFRGRREELYWVIGVFLLLLALYYLDYEWVVRPFVADRADPALDPKGREANEMAREPGGERRDARRLASITLPWILYRAWLPLITVSVNLGFERLDHRRVVQAMLVGLREQYRRVFLAWNSALANLGRLVGAILLLAVVTLVGQRWFALPMLSSEQVARPAPGSPARGGGICSFLHKMSVETGSSAVNLICELDSGDAVLHLLFFNLLETQADVQFQEGRNHLLFYLFPYQAEDWPVERFRRVGAKTVPPLVRRGIHFRLYHLLLLIVLLFLGRLLLRKIPLLPYREIVRKIDDVLENLTGSTSMTSRVGRWQPAQWLQGFFIGERVRQIQHEPFDPRTIEFEFLQILQEIQEAAIVLPGAHNQRLSLPVPEVTFFFDELDKLGTRVEPAAEGGSEPQQSEILNAERRRSMELHKLLADSKNLLSVAPARFIFVGGRNLHDEWLADQTSRLPLLTSIFQSEVYLPSLLADRPYRDQPKRLPTRIEQFLAAQKERSRRQFESYHGKLFFPSFSLGLEERAGESFVDPERFETADGDGIFLKAVSGFEILNLGGRAVVGEAQLVRDFLQFLTYRSLGNPKRLRELLAWFVRPVGRYVGRRDLREKAFCCDHVLLFDEIERFRIQLLARIYRHLNFTFDQGFTRRDDKTTVSVFYLSDFLFKFHRRAFSWSSLERVEDMVHIHRAPDLREVMETMVERWAERFLHRIRNGMYDFRFRSEIAREIEYISRHSPAEMAAFNFTLDESQALKSTYETTIRRLKDGPGRELQDFVSGLGELHEFDQEFETARVHYRHAILLIDGELRAVTGGSELLEKSSPMMQILAGWAPGPQEARLYLTWGIARLRLMLQIGMTFELERNHERANVEYDNAATLARAMLLALLDDEGRLLADAAEISRREVDRGEDRLDILKHLNLFFQPTFAGAWAAEKLIGAVDTSTTLVETTLTSLRTMLPFVREPKVKAAGGPVGVRHSNFALIAAELHNKAGDLCFFKGHQVVSVEDIRRWSKRTTRKPRHGKEGYLLRAHYHYAVGLHELRRFIAYRKKSSAKKWNPQPTDAYVRGESRETLASEVWPDYVFRSLGGTFNDFAEAMLGRISLYGLFQCLNRREIEERAWSPVEQATKHLVEACTRWLEALDEEAKEDGPGSYRINVPLGSGLLNAGTLKGWFGVWNREWDAKKPDDPVVICKEWQQHDDVARLSVALNLMLVGAKYLERGGYVEDAAREFLKVSELATSYLWWWQSILHLVAHRDLIQYEVLDLDAKLCGKIHGHPFWPYLERVALYGLEKSDQLFRRSRQANESNFYQVGDKIPVACLVAACSLGLVAYQQTPVGAAIGVELYHLAGSWLGDEANAIGDRPRFTGSRSDYRKLLMGTLERHSFPMLARLQGLKVLIDDAILSEAELGQLDEIKVWQHELYDLAERLNSPLHFTPMHAGITHALVYLYFVKIRHCSSPDFEVIRRVAQRDLMRSEEMYTLHRFFYESISDLYYLYDDFNDRQVHFNHALQMAASELVSMLRHLVSSPDFQRVQEIPLTIPQSMVETTVP